MDLNYQFIGDSKADRLLIFLHEGLGSIEQWKSFPEKVCRETGSYGLIYDRSGYGKSSGDLKNRSVNYLHEAAEELNEVLNCSPSTYDRILYGHSDGGTIALIYAALYPNELKAIITEAAHVFVEEETITGVKAALAPFQEGKFEGLKKYHGDRYEEVFMAWNSIWLSEAFRSWNIEALLPQITCTQLIIQGESDQYGTLKQVESIATKTSGKSTPILIPNCGHSPHKENEIQTLITIKSFLDALS